MKAIWRHAIDGTRPEWWTGNLLPWIWVEIAILSLLLALGIYWGWLA